MERNAGPILRWLGVAGVELSYGGQVLAIDPFLTRPSLWRLLFAALRSDQGRVRAGLPVCDHVIISHSHYDHCMDLAAILQLANARAYGSPNTCRLMLAQGVAAQRLRQIEAGEQLELGPFAVDVLPAAHTRIFGRKTPFSGITLSSARPPKRFWHYRMDLNFGFLVTVDGMRVLVSPGEDPSQAVPADVLLVAAHRSSDHYRQLLERVRPRLLIPIHWDDFLRPLSAPLRAMPDPQARFSLPLVRLDLQALNAALNRLSPGLQVLLPEPMTRYRLRSALTSDLNTPRR